MLTEVAVCLNFWDCEFVFNSSLVSVGNLVVDQLKLCIPTFNMDNDVIKTKVVDEKNERRMLLKWAMGHGRVTDKIALPGLRTPLLRPSCCV
jgi:hypothetical protein